MTTRRSRHEGEYGLLDASQPCISDEDWIKLCGDLHLSPREVDVLKCLFVGDSEKQIASRLGLSQATVHTHFQRLHHKLGVRSRTELMALVVRKLLEESRRNPFR